MSYQIEIIRKESLTTSRWSGGTTTQLYISPSTALYAERKFSWRISSAMVEVEESDFTPLPGYQRILMVLEGKLDLKHQNQHEVQLKEYQQDTFWGDWQTKSKGLVTDFNLMLNKECQGSLQAIVLPELEEKTIILRNAFTKSIDSQLLTDAFYLSTGKIEISLANGMINVLNQGDLLLVKRSADAHSAELRIKNCLKHEAGIVQAKIAAPIGD